MIPTASAWLAELRAGRTTAVAALEACFAAIDARNGALNAVVAEDRAGALAMALTVDEARRSGRDPGPLGGLPLTVKDVINVAGLPTTGGDPARAGAVAVADAPAVARLRAAGAIPFGKSNVPLNAADYQTGNELFGVTRSPWDPDRTPGGSSGGAAAAVAAGLVPVELGTDLSGSLRLPAHYCGIASLKPTHGVVPAGGTYAGVPDVRDPGDLLVVGPLARSVADLALVFDVLAAPAEPAAAGFQALLPHPFPGWRPRIALWMDEPFCPPDPPVRAVIAAAVEVLADRGTVVHPSVAPWSAAEFFANHVALMYGAMAAAAPADTFDFFTRRAARATDAWRDPAAEPTLLLAAGLTLRHRDWLEASEQRYRYREQLLVEFQRYDLIVCPAAPATAPRHDDRRLDRRRLPLAGAERPALQQTYWAAIASSLGLPAVTVPLGLASDGLPVGVQVLAAPCHDHFALAGAALLEAAGSGFRPPPGCA